MDGEGGFFDLGTLADPSNACRSPASRLPEESRYRSDQAAQDRHRKVDRHRTNPTDAHKARW